MIYLIFKMFIYLVLAGGIGGAAGWLLRNLQAQQTEEKARRQVADAKSKVPQLESLLRGRDEQVAKLKNEISERRQENKAQAQELKQAAKELLEQKREANRLKQNPRIESDLTIDDHEDGPDAIIAELSQEIVDLKARLAQQNVDEAPSAQSGSGDTHSDDQQADYIKQNELLMAELDAARLQATQLERSMLQTKTDLERQKSTVRELERERDMQNKSLQVLHQQLELERSNRLAQA